MSVLVAGIGNIFFGDDAFGSEVARRLLQRPWADGVRVVDFGIRGLDLTFALLDHYETVILIDAAPRGGAPGTLYTIEPDLEALTGADIEAHSMQPLKVLAAAKALGAQFKRIVVVGCEPSPATVDPAGAGSMGLSAPVQAAVAEAVALVERLIETAIDAATAGRALETLETRGSAAQSGESQATVEAGPKSSKSIGGSSDACGSRQSQ
jgi:hydrogenase maturation protease